MADYSRLTVQLPPELHERMSVAAKAARRSLSAEAVYRLEQTFALESRVAQIVDSPGSRSFSTYQDPSISPLSSVRQGTPFRPVEGDPAYEPFEDPA